MRVPLLVESCMQRYINIFVKFNTEPKRYEQKFPNILLHFEFKDTRAYSLLLLYFRCMRLQLELQLESFG